MDGAGKHRHICGGAGLNRFKSLPIEEAQMGSAWKRMTAVMSITVLLLISHMGPSFVSAAAEI